MTTHQDATRGGGPLIREFGLFGQSAREKSATPAVYRDISAYGPPSSRAPSSRHVHGLGGAERYALHGATSGKRPQPAQRALVGAA